MVETLLRIGAFAERGSVSVKTLRYYDEAGVLRPAYVESRSRYRYYRVDQLAALFELRLLRELGATVANLRDWVRTQKDPASQRRVLESLRERQRQVLNRDRLRLRYLESWLRIGGPPPNPSLLHRPTVRSIPPIAALTLRDHVTTTSGAIGLMFEAAERFVACESARTCQRPFLILHDGYRRKRKSDVEVCVPVKLEAMTAVGGRFVKGIARAACLSFNGSYQYGPPTAAALNGWAAMRGESPVGPIRESYIRFGADQRGYRLPTKVVVDSETDYRTELQLPISSC
jgi:DNA-binding transcriptional MerR regulator